MHESMCDGLRVCCVSNHDLLASEERAGHSSCNGNLLQGVLFVVHQSLPAWSDGAVLVPAGFCLRACSHTGWMRAGRLTRIAVPLALSVAGAAWNTAVNPC
eukprot:4580646-Amphidinium_carterae.1